MEKYNAPTEEVLRRGFQVVLLAFLHDLTVAAVLLQVSWLQVWFEVVKVLQITTTVDFYVSVLTVQT